MQYTKNNLNQSKIQVNQTGENQKRAERFMRLLVIIAVQDGLQDN